MPGRTIGDLYYELHLDDSHVGREARTKGTKVAKEFGAQINTSLKALNVEPINMKANPREALAAIALTNHQLEQLRDKAETVELRVQANKAIADLAKFKNSIGDAGGDAATGFAARFGAKVGPLIATTPLSGPMGIAVAAGAAAAAPVLSAALAGAVTAGVAAGVVGAGLIIGAKDPLVAEAGKIAAAEFGAGFQDVASPFKAEIIEAMGVARAQFRALRPELTGLFADAAPYVPILVNALADIAHELLPDIATATRNAQPLIEMLAREGPEAAAVFGRVLTMLSSTAEESAMVLSSLIKVIELLTLTTGGSLTLLAKIAPIVQGPLLTLAGLLPDVGEGSRDAAAGTDALTEELRKSAAESLAAAKAMEVQKAGAVALSGAQATLAATQRDLQTTLDGLAPRMGRATQLTDALRTASDNLFGAQIRNTDANEDYEASWDSLSDSVKSNKASLDIHTQAGRTNRDALQALLRSSNDLYLANIDAGQSIDSARKKHETRTEAVRKESIRLGLNKDQTADLIKTYGQIPGRKTTDLILSGLKAIADQLTNVYLAQRALAEGKTIAQIRGGFQGNARLFKAEGGPIDGPGTATSDSIPIMASRGEFMQRASAVDYYGVDAMNAINQRRIPREAIRGYASGGPIAPVDTSRRWPFTVDVSDSFVMSKAAALRLVTPAAPTAGGESLSFMVRALKQAFPALGLISGYRPGSRTLSGSLSYHAVKRAVDYPPNVAMAEWVYNNFKARTKEFISPFQAFNIHNGQSHTYTGAVWNQHNFAGGNAHNHWAMDRGGYLMPGWNPPIYNGTGRPEPVTPAPTMDKAIAVLLRIADAVERNPAEFGAVLNGTQRSGVQRARAMGPIRPGGR